VFVFISVIIVFFSVNCYVLLQYFDTVGWIF